MRIGKKVSMLLAALALSVTAGCATVTPAGTSTPAASAVVPEVLLLNQASPGAKFELAPHLVAGQINIVDFYSEFCPPCMRIAPALEKLAAARADLVVRKLDINRPGTRGIDWSSPLAQQYGLDSIPHFKIYDAQGGLMAEGEAAASLLFAWLRAENISF